MMQRGLNCVLAGVLVAVLVGCGSSSGGDSKGSSMDQLAGAVDAQNAARQQAAQEAASKAAAEKQAAEQKAAAEQAKAQAANAAATEPAGAKKVGDRQVVAGGGYYGAIIGARRHVMNVVDSLSWIQGVRNFKAEKGRKPKDTAEFFRDCVKTYDLELPKIEPDEEYVYDPNGETDGDFGQLYVVKKEVGTAPAGSSPAGPTK